MSNGLLLDEPLLTVQPAVAMALGLNEAIALQQVNYWMARTNNVRNGRKWVYNSIAEWSKQFPFWSPSTVKRTFAALESAGVLVSDCFNEDKLDHSKWYSIDYEKFYEITDPVLAARRADLEKSGGSPIGSNCTNRSGQADPMRRPKMTKSLYKTETTSEINKRATSLPAGFEVTDELRQWAKEKGYASPDNLLEAFKLYHTAKGSTYKDWKAAFQMWIKKDKEFSSSKSKTSCVSSNKTKSLADMDYSESFF